MNKIKHKSEKRVTEIQTIVFSDFKGLVAENMIITKDDISELKMTTFKLGGKSLFYIPNNVSINGFTYDSDGEYQKKFYDNHIKPNIRVFTLDELKKLDLNQLYYFDNGNLIRAVTRENVTKLYVLEYDNTARNYDRLVDHVKSLNLNVYPIEIDSNCDLNGKVLMEVDQLRNHSIVNAYGDCEDSRGDVWTQLNGVSLFNGSAASFKLWCSWNDSLYGGSL